MNNCFNCNNPTKNPKYCSSSCAASITNKNRPPRSIESKQKTAKSVSDYHTISRGPKKILYCLTCQLPLKERKKYCSLKCMGITQLKHGLHSKLTKSTCSFCKIIFFAKTRKNYCNVHRDIMPNKRAIYRFKFNVYHYPNLFDLDLLNKVGFYAPKGKSGSWNPNGLSRDHRISVSEAIKCNYDPYYITHPLNCDLMVHHENNKKKTKSTITFQELKILVDKFDARNINYTY